MPISVFLIRLQNANHFISMIFLIYCKGTTSIIVLPPPPLIIFSLYYYLLTLQKLHKYHEPDEANLPNQS